MEFGEFEALNAGVMEAVMLNHIGSVAEATGDNIFVLRGTELLTPPTSSGILEGITRNVVMELARDELGLTVRECVLSRCDLYTADEVFLTGTAAEVIGVVDIDARRIGDGTPGPITRSLTKSFRRRASRTGTPIE